MSAEQLLDDHQFWYAFEGYDKCRCGREVPSGTHSAHVVAALTNAGHLPLDPDDVQRLRLVIVFTDSSDVTRVPMQTLLQRLDALDAAAARVAEGGA